MNKNNINLLTKCGCALIGWNPTILAECGEASFRTLKKYMSAILILAIVWGTIGYLFADRYIGVSNTLAKAAVSAIFVVIIICIERFIILKVGKSKVTGIMRIILAFLMATLGATIFDQMIFKNDVEVKMKESRDEMANEAIKRQSVLLDEEMNNIVVQRDSVQRELLSLYEQINAKPNIETTNSTVIRVPNGVDESGKTIYQTQTQVTKSTMPNPLNSQARLDEETLKTYDGQLENLRNQKINLADKIREEYATARVGFLEELKVLFRYIVFQDTIAAIFYVCLFLFMMSLEILVVSSKLGETDCDYDLLVEHQLKVKNATLQRTQERLLNENQ